MNRRTIAIAVGATAVLLVSLVAVFGLPLHLLFTPTETGAVAGLADDDVESEVVAEDLDVPWEVRVLEDDRYLVTERTGDLLLIEDGERHVLERFDELDEPLLGEGGLLGIAAHPDFAENRYVYVYQTVDRESVENTVRRFEVDFEDRELENETTIIDGIPSDRIHNGGRIAFGPDDRLYVTTGDASESELAQDRDSLAGKILRLEDDGSIPDDNPFGTEVYSYGHRNPQGLTWDDEGRLWATEHGSSARDELNVIESGRNYGWPTITGPETQPEMESPAFHSTQYETWAPAGAAAHDGSVFFAGLRGERLYEAQTTGGGVTAFVAHFAGDFGRIRAVTLGPDREYLYLTTSNTDGRGEERANDDRIVRVPVDAFRAD
ncbi:PQQ-dependent sugar dehydrogenase [Natrinema amylolyticum]|uniref:PQQ-dependent sugar dehydrogenase n=1 Tax=Natrinema amylolyticum TaxID=2878679 RepID=UPI001CFBBB3E|nr:PQQ-dependent sugar dehydrogenase [Natrinema amylolyticum]